MTEVECTKTIKKTQKVKFFASTLATSRPLVKLKVCVSNRDLIPRKQPQSCIFSCQDSVTFWEIRKGRKTRERPECACWWNLAQCTTARRSAAGSSWITSGSDNFLPHNDTQRNLAEQVICCWESGELCLIEMPLLKRTNESPSSKGSSFRIWSEFIFVGRFVVLIFRRIAKGQETACTGTWMFLFCKQGCGVVNKWRWLE